MQERHTTHKITIFANRSPDEDWGSSGKEERQEFIESFTRNAVLFDESIIDDWINYELKQAGANSNVASRRVESRRTALLNSNNISAISLAEGLEAFNLILRTAIDKNKNYPMVSKEWMQYLSFFDLEYAMMQSSHFARIPENLLSLKKASSIKNKVAFWDDPSGDFDLFGGFLMCKNIASFEHLDRPLSDAHNEWSSPRLTTYLGARLGEFLWKNIEEYRASLLMDMDEFKKQGARSDAAWVRWTEDAVRTIEYCFMTYGRPIPGVKSLPAKATPVP